MANLTVSADIDAFMGAANNAAALTSLGTVAVTVDDGWPSNTYSGVKATLYEYTGGGALNGLDPAADDQIKFLTQTVVALIHALAQKKLPDQG